jgi:hypothetical protein
VVAFSRRCLSFGFFALAACGSPSARTSRAATEEATTASATTVATSLAPPTVGENVLFAADAPLFPSAIEARAHPATVLSSGRAVVAYEVRAVVGDVLEVLTTLEEIDDCGEYIPVDRGDPRGGYAIAAYVPLAAAIPRLTEAESRGTTVAARGAPLRRRNDGRGVFLDGALAARFGAVSASKIALSTARGTDPTPVLVGQEPVVCTPTPTGIVAAGTVVVVTAVALAEMPDFRGAWWHGCIAVAPWSAALAARKSRLVKGINRFAEANLLFVLCLETLVYRDRHGGSLGVGAQIASDDRLDRAPVDRTGTTGPATPRR